MLADEITPAMDGIPAEKAAPLPARGRGVESWPALRVHAYVREAVKAAEENAVLITRRSVQEVEEGGAPGRLEAEVRRCASRRRSSLRSVRAPSSKRTPSSRR
jgi:hypothetical protein